VASREPIKAWWAANKNASHGDLFRLIEHLRSLDSDRRDDDLFHMALYGDRWAKERFTKGARRSREDRLCFNLAKALCDTAQSEVASVQPRPTLLTQRGSWTHKRRAQAMELMLEGEYERNNLYEQKDDGFLDAAKIGTVGYKVFAENGMPKIELIPPGQVLIDPVEGQHRKPRTTIQIMPMQRDVARGCYGDNGGRIDRAINAAPLFDPKLFFPWLPTDNTVEQILVAEAWKLPDPESWDHGKPGRRVVCVETGTLDDEEWKRAGFPMAFWRYDKESSGFWGRGIVKNVRSAQRELNYVLQKIQDCIHRSAGYRVLVEGGSKVNVEKITNEPGSILRYFGAIPPQIQVDNTVPEQLFRHGDDIIRRAFDQEGVSIMAATARKPAGLDSGAALREYTDIKSERFLIKTRSLERFFGVEIAKLVIDEKREIAERGDDKPVKVRQRRGRGSVMKMINWEDASLDEDDYSIQVFPASALPSTPAGRIAAVEQWIASGFVTRDQGMQLLDFPDLESFVSFELAPYDALLSAIETMIEDGDYVTPEPTQNLDLAIDLMTAAHLKFRTDGAPEDRTELLLRYLDDVEYLRSQAAAAGAAPAQPGAGAAAAMAAGAVPPEAMAGAAMPGAPPMMAA
jgi:hypothetical protein